MIYLTKKEKDHKESFLVNYDKKIINLYRKRKSLSDYYWSIFDSLLTPGMTILDLGAGEKGMISLFINRNITVIGLDMSVEDLKNNTHLSHRICGDAHNLPFKKKFDFVISQWLLEHLPHPHQFLYEAHRVMKNGGYLSLVSNSLYCPLMFFNAVMPAPIRDWIKKRLLPKEVDEDTFPTYYRANTRSSILNITEDVGLKEETFIYASDLSFFIFNRIIFGFWIIIDLLSEIKMLRPIRMHFLGLYRK
jgi:ubiquinone/menaquinone biosynthesis C-methylase UbiE